VNSISRDWISGQVTAIETGILSFEAVVLTADGRPQHIAETNLLPARRSQRSCNRQGLRCNEMDAIKKFNAIVQNRVCDRGRIIGARRGLAGGGQGA
jgi:hypothetical protein